MGHLSVLNKYFWKYRLRLFTGLVFIFLSNYFNVLSPQVTGYVIDFVQRETNMSGYEALSEPPAYDFLVQKLIAKLSTISGWQKVVALCGITILLLALLRGIFLFLMRQTIIVMSRHIEYDQKNEVYKHYQSLDTAFYKINSTGDLMNRISEDVSRVRMFTGPAVMYIANLLAIISLSIFFMVKRSPELTVYVLIPLPILAITIYFVNTSIHQKSEKIQESLSSLTANAQESYSGIRVIKSFVQENAMLRFFTKNADGYKKNSVSLARLEAIYFPSITLLIGISTLLTIMIGGLYHLNNPGQLGKETIVEFVMYINMLTFPVSAIGLTASMVQRAAASQKRINEFLELQPSVKNKVAIATPDIHGDIFFQNLSFTYPHTGIQALSNLNLAIKKGDKIAIVGRTGSGKSTLVQLLLRMYDPTVGKIIIGDNDLKNIDLQKWRSQISYVPQDVFLFSDTVANNISFGTDALAPEEIKKAATFAAVDREVQKFSEGYDTLIGERGVTLSGGQKQRISIARALSKKTGLVVFDDCLSAVDARTEREITVNLNQFFEDRTAIVVTHRIFSLINFTKIIVLQDGQIVEEGTHPDLLLRGGVYAEMHHLQQKVE